MIFWAISVYTLLLYTYQGSIASHVEPAADTWGYFYSGSSSSPPHGVSNDPFQYDYGLDTGSDGYLDSIQYDETAISDADESRSKHREDYTGKGQASDFFAPRIMVPPVPHWSGDPPQDETMYLDLPAIPLSKILSRHGPQSERYGEDEEDDIPFEIIEDDTLPTKQRSGPTYNVSRGVLYRNGLRYAGWAHEADVTDEERATVAKIMSKRWNCKKMSEARKRMSAWITRDYAEAILNPKTSEDVMDDITDKTMARHRSSKGATEKYVESLLIDRGLKATSTRYRYRGLAMQLIKDAELTPEEAVNEILARFGFKPKKKPTFAPQRSD